MNIIVNCTEFSSIEIFELEQSVGFEGCWVYHKARLWAKENRSDKIYRGKLKALAGILRTNESILLSVLDHLPSTMVSCKGQYWELIEITKELKTLELRIRGAKAPLNKGMGKDIIVNRSLLEGESERKPKKPISEFGSVLIPESLTQPEHLEAWKSYLEYKQATRHKFKSLKSAQMFLTRWATRPNEFVEALEQTIAAQWQAPPWDKVYPSTQSPTHNVNRSPVAILEPNGTISGQVNFNTLPFNAKKDIYAAHKDKQLDEWAEREDKRRAEEKLLKEKQNDTIGNQNSVKAIICDLSQRRAYPTGNR